MEIGRFTLRNNLALAPMAGVTDLPFRRICQQFGASFTPSEMLSSDTQLWQLEKSRKRLSADATEQQPRVIQIVGADPARLAHAANQAVTYGAEIIDINMGCPAKKVCNKAAGSALLRDETLVGRILETVVQAVGVPVTLKTRTGWDHQQKNGVRIAKLAEACGIKALSIHGRTRADQFNGHAEYDTIREIKAAVKIPVFANGDICTASQAYEVLQYTGADGIMIGRGAHGQPWLFAQVAAFLRNGVLTPAPDTAARGAIIEQHLRALYLFYGPQRGVKLARKHLKWYCSYLNSGTLLWQQVCRLDSAAQQLAEVSHYFQRAADKAITA